MKGRPAKNVHLTVAISDLSESFDFARGKEVLAMLSLILSIL